jgi:hypothetical protein
MPRPANDYGASVSPEPSATNQQNNALQYQILSKYSDTIPQGRRNFLAAQLGELRGGFYKNAISKTYVSQQLIYSLQSPAEINAFTELLNASGYEHLTALESFRKVKTNKLDSFYSTDRFLGALTEQRRQYITDEIAKLKNAFLPDGNSAKALPLAKELINGLDSAHELKGISALVQYDSDLHNLHNSTFSGYVERRLIKIRGIAVKQDAPVSAPIGVAIAQQASGDLIGSVENLIALKYVNQISPQRIDAVCDEASKLGRLHNGQIDEAARLINAERSILGFKTQFEISLYEDLLRQFGYDKLLLNKKVSKILDAKVASISSNRDYFAALGEPRSVFVKKVIKHIKALGSQRRNREAWDITAKLIKHLQSVDEVRRLDILMQSDVYFNALIARNKTYNTLINKQKLKIRQRDAGGPAIPSEFEIGELSIAKAAPAIQQKKVAAPLTDAQEQANNLGRYIAQYQLNVTHNNYLRSDDAKAMTALDDKDRTFYGTIRYDGEPLNIPTGTLIKMRAFSARTGIALNQILGDPLTPQLIKVGDEASVPLGQFFEVGGGQMQLKHLVQKKNGSYLIKTTEVTEFPSHKPPADNASTRARKTSNKGEINSRYR